jgi:hypothetical protein
MIKAILLLITSLYLFSISNKIVVDINGISITNMDIKNISNKFNLSRKQSINKLIIDILYNQEFNNRKIIATKKETDKYMQNIASSNNLSLLELQNNISQDMDLNTFKEDINERIKKEKLIIQILQEKKFFIDERILKKHYQDNKNMYAKYKMIKIKEYITRDKNELLNIKKNPLIISNKVQVKQNNIYMENIKDMDIKNELLSTKKNRFSNIIHKNRLYIMLYIISKEANGYNSFEKVKNNIYMYLYEKSKNKIINRYFARKKLQTNIVYK